MRATSTLKSGWPLVIGSIIFLIIAFLVAATPIRANANGCSFERGFAVLKAQIPYIVGDCMENEHPVDVGTAQQTTGGLLVWRKADNWTAFTDGYRTWINGPNGLQSRLNTERFPWEAAQTAPGATSTTTSSTAEPTWRGIKPNQTVIVPIGSVVSGDVAAKTVGGDNIQMYDNQADTGLVVEMMVTTEVNAPFGASYTNLPPDQVVQLALQNGCSGPPNGCRVVTLKVFGQNGVVSATQFYRK